MKKIFQRGLTSCMALLDAVRVRVSSVVQSEEARALAHKVRTEAGKDTARFSRVIKRRALQVIQESQRKISRAKALVTEDWEQKRGKRKGKQ